MEFQFSNEDQAFRGELRDFIEQERLPVWDRNDSGSDDGASAGDASGGDGVDSEPLRETDPETASDPE